MTLGIDIGGTNLCLGLIENGRICRSFSVPSFRGDASMEQTLDYLSFQIDKILHPQTEKIGIGVPSVVDIRRGIVYDAQNIHSWKEVPLKAYLEDRFHIPVAVNNDANCFAMGVYGADPSEAKPEVLCVVTLGTGVGMGIVNEGKLFCGVNCGAGELGTLPYRASILEDYCSKKFFEGTGWNSLTAYEAASGGNPEALLLFEDLGRNLGALLCAVLFAYDPSHIALAGGIAHNHPFFRKAMEDYLWSNYPYKRSLERLTIDIFTDNDIPVIGASLI